jgi:hypothetical protein
LHNIIQVSRSALADPKMAARDARWRKFKE